MALVPDFIRADLDKCKVALRHARKYGGSAYSAVSGLLVLLVERWRDQPLEMTEDDPPVAKAHVSEIVSYWRDEIPPGEWRDAVTNALKDFADSEHTASYRDSLVKEAEYRAAETKRGKDASTAVDLALIEAQTSIELSEVITALEDRAHSPFWSEAVAKLPTVLERKAALESEEQAAIDAFMKAEENERAAQEAEAIAEEKAKAQSQPFRGTLPSKDINGEPINLADLNLDSEIDTLRPE